MSGFALNVRVKAITWEADGVYSLDLRPVGDATLPPFGAGSHVDLHLPSGITRSYSLVNAPSEPNRYQVAVHRDVASRGGSRFVHDNLRVGEIIRVSPPRNTFPLVENASLVVLIAGGIGITPMFCMARRLTELGRPWHLHYAAKSAARAAFIDELRALVPDDPGRLSFAFGDVSAARLDLGRIVGEAPSSAHLYCCGPVRMLENFEAVARGRPPAQVHVEYFAPLEEAAHGGFTVVLARSGLTFTVPEDKTILEQCIAHGVEVPHSCMEGVCGSCEVTVLEGTPDHRDVVLSKNERAAGNTMMICRSGCKGSRLVLDL